MTTRSPFIPICALALSLTLTPPRLLAESGLPAPRVANAALSVVSYNYTPVWYTWSYFVPALIFTAPPDADGDRWLFAHVLEPNRIGFEVNCNACSPDSDLEPFVVLASDLDEGGGPIADVVIDAPPELKQHLEVRFSAKAVVIFTRKPIPLTRAGFSATLVRGNATTTPHPESSLPT